MKYFYFKILILCIFLPPVLYIFTLQYSEHYLTGKHTEVIRQIYIGDTKPLFEGSAALKDVIERNIDHYLGNQLLIFWGGRLDVTVATNQGVLLYPAFFNEDDHEFSRLAPMAVAAENYRLLAEGVKLTVDVRISHNTLLANLILGFYMILSTLFLYVQYQSTLDKACRDDLEIKREMARLVKKEKGYARRVNDLEDKRKKLVSLLSEAESNLKQEKIKASRNEDALMEEVFALEEAIKDNQVLQQGQQAMIAELEERIKALEKRDPKGNRRQQKASSVIQKRFYTLYKNMTFHERAIAGYINLSDDLKIKGEEIIHRLNEDSDSVPVKRKVFGKKSMKTTLEVLFGYKGRLYFRKNQAGKPEVLVIGTKNTQLKDLEFLNKMNS